jgi:hypothetical protein
MASRAVKSITYRFLKIIQQAQSIIEGNDATSYLAYTGLYIHHCKYNDITKNETRYSDIPIEEDGFKGMIIVILLKEVSADSQLCS